VKKRVALQQIWAASMYCLAGRWFPPSGGPRDRRIALGIAVGVASKCLVPCFRHAVPKYRFTSAVSHEIGPVRTVRRSEARYMFVNPAERYGAIDRRRCLAFAAVRLVRCPATTQHYAREILDACGNWFSAISERRVRAERRYWCPLRWPAIPRF
jgi:hypothetical protein